MATTTEILSPISPTPAMNSCGFYRYRVPKAAPVSWQTHHKQLCNRFSSSLSLLESSLLGGGTSAETSSSLPPSPSSFASLERCKKEKYLWDDSLRGGDYSSTSSCPSSGYCSGSSSDSSCGTFFPSFTPVEKNCPPSEDFPQPDRTPITIPPPASDTDVAHSSPASCQTEATEPRISSPPSATPSPQSGSGSHDTPSGSDLSGSDLTSVYVPSKRSCSESSSSSSSGGQTTGDEGARRRVKDQDGFIRRAACVCVNEDESKVVLISSKNDGGGWLVPGGGLETGEGEVEAAVREAWEEAGITGHVKRCLGVFQSEDEATHKKKRTAVYVLAVGEQHSTFPEARLGRVREWFSIDNAVDHLSHCKPHQTAYLRAL